VVKYGHAKHEISVCCPLDNWPLDNWQRGFGSAVAVREALYALTVLAALCGNPAFLLVDVGASVRDTGAGFFGGYGFVAVGGYGFLAAYVLAPEKLRRVGGVRRGRVRPGPRGAAPGHPPFRAVLGLPLAATPQGVRTRILRSLPSFLARMTSAAPGPGTTATYWRPSS
jgi:hypothetical protein